MPARCLIAALPLALVLGCQDGSESPMEPPPPAAAFAPVLSFTQLAAGGFFTCGLTSSGTVYCWGENTFGELGLGRPTINAGVSRPAAVVGGLHFRQISTGVEHACGITTDSLAYCWGHNLYGRLGDGTTTDRSIPTAVAGGHKFRQIDAGFLHTCAVTTANLGYCWGHNGLGQLGDGTLNAAGRPRPVAVAGAHRFRRVATGDGHSCGLTTDNRVWCWGDNYAGKLGDGTQMRRLVPTLTKGDREYRHVDAGGGHTCAVTLTNRAFCWGNGNGFGGPLRTPRPTAVSGDLTFTRMTLGEYYTCGETIDHQPYCWGIGEFGQLGNGELNSVLLQPTLVLGGLRFSQMTAGWFHACGRTAENVAYCWGNNVGGQLGDGTQQHRALPTRVLGPF
jgi:alpha-tubulin suppressor-like RCC1 family protein